MSKMHADEFHIDKSLVQKLIAQQFPEWKDLELTPVLSSGTDHALYRLGNKRVVRLPRIGWAVENVEKEYFWLPKLAPFLPLSIPTPLAKGLPTKEYPYPWSIHSWLEGSHPPVGTLSLAFELATFISALHSVELPDGPLSRRGIPLIEKDLETRQALAQLEGIVDVERVTHIWEKVLKAPSWSKSPVWVHSDLSPSNLLEVHGHLSAVIDFSMVGIGDPACDLVIAWNLLPLHARAAFRSALDVDDATWVRGQGWALSNALIALPYYKETNPTLANNARHVIAEVIADHKRKEVPSNFLPHQQEQTHSEKKTKHIAVVPYNPEWAERFEREAEKIQKTLGSNGIAVHHIGSTAVPGLAAKPIIDMIGVVKNVESAIQPLENLGYTYKGEFNIPLRYFFNRSEGVEANLHVYEEGHPEIELNLIFRDYLRSHPEARETYAERKNALLKEKSSYEKSNSLFTGYNLGKDAFIRDILKAAHFNRIRIVKSTHYAEWEATKRLRQQYFFDPLSITDPYTWTFNHKEHAHLILYQGTEIIGYTHIQFWPDHRAALRMIVIDEPYRKHSFGSQFLHLCEQWLKKQRVRSLHTEARSESIKFYKKNGYTEMPFNDTSGAPPSPHDVALGKIL